MRRLCFALLVVLACKKEAPAVVTSPPVAPVLPAVSPGALEPAAASAAHLRPSNEPAVPFGEEGVTGARSWRVAESGTDDQGLVVTVVLKNDVLMATPVKAFSFELVAGSFRAAPKEVAFTPQANGLLTPGERVTAVLHFALPAGQELHEAELALRDGTYQLRLALSRH